MFSKHWYVPTSKRIIAKNPWDVIFFHSYELISYMLLYCYMTKATVSVLILASVHFSQNIITCIMTLLVDPKQFETYRYNIRWVEPPNVENNFSYMVAETGLFIHQKQVYSYIIIMFQSLDSTLKCLLIFCMEPICAFHHS